MIVENILLVVENILLVVGYMLLVRSEDILSLGIRSHSGQRIFSIFFSPSPFSSGFENIMICPWFLFISPQHFCSQLASQNLTLPNFCETFIKNRRCPLSSFSDLLSTETRPTTMSSETKGWKIVQLEWLLQNPSISCIPAGQTSRYTAPPLPNPPLFPPSPQTPFCSLTPPPPPRSDRAAEETELIRESTVIPDTSSYVVHQYFQEVGHCRSPRNKISKECQRWKRNIVK